MSVAAEAMEFAIRAEAVSDRLAEIRHDAEVEAARFDADPERMQALVAEAELCMTGIREIRREQLAWDLERRSKRHRWWEFWR
jgi:hypothetical protein